MKQAERERLEVLTLQMLDGELSPSEADELEALLEDEDAVRLHGLLLEQEAALRGERAELDLVSRTVAELESGKRVEARVLETIRAQSRGLWTQRAFRFAAAAALLVLVAFGGAGAWVATWSAAPQEALVFASKTIEPGTPAYFKALLRNAETLAPYANVTVRFVLLSADGGEAWAATAATDAKGVAWVEQAVPSSLPEGPYTLRVDPQMTDDVQRVARTVEVRRSYRIFIATDKPRYQPGQTVHMRALAMTASGVKPAPERELTFRVRDAKGNLVLERAQKTSEHGLAATDFELADQVNMGRYVVSAAIGTTESQRSVTVERYVLPKLKVAVETDEPFYAPGAELTGTVKADYVFGEPVTAGDVEVKLIDARSDVLMATVEATRKSPGSWTFAAKVPRRFGVLEPGSLAVEATVKDRAGFSNATRIERTVTDKPLLVEVAVAGGRPVYGVPNHYFLSVRRPDGRPAKAKGTLGGVAFESDASGLAEVTLVPDSAPYLALIVEGIERTITLGATNGIVLHSDRAIYDGGATVSLTLAASMPSGTAFVDAVQGGHTLWTQAVELKQGGAELAFDVPADVHGPVRLRAFHVDEGGHVMRADRVVVVRARRDLAISATLDRESYRPGDTAKLTLAVTRDGAPAPAALSLAGVDESVFALSETRPGMEQAYFELDRSLLDPTVSLFPLERVMSLTGDARERAASAALAGIRSPDDAVALQGGDSFRARSEAVARERRTWHRHILGAALSLPMLLGLLLLLSAMWRLGREVRREVSPSLELGGAMRNVILAWMGCVLLPILLAVMGGSMGRATGALIGAVLGALIGGVLLRHTSRPMREHAPVELLFYAFVVCALGVVSMLAAMEERVVPDWSFAIALLVIYAAWCLVAGLLSAVGQNLAKGTSAAAAVWLVASRASLALLPAVGLTLVVMGVSYKAEEAAQVVDMVEDGTGQRALPTAAPSVAAVATPMTKSQGQALRVRSDFPETLLWKPQLITDAQGRVELEVPLADSITTWRLSMSAVSTAGELGAAEQGLRVFQPFFVEPSLPVALTQDDVVTVPVAVFNYLDAEQEVTVTLGDADWLTTKGPTTQRLKLGPREVRSVELVIQAKRAGEHRFFVKASAGEVADAVERVVSVVPNGERVDSVRSGELKTSQKLAIDVPAGAIPGSEDLLLKLYPGAFSQVAEGMEGIFKKPYGCFEQTSSVTYPSLLVYDYLRTNKRLQPELQAKAERLIGIGYQRLLSFEVPGGGFEWFGKDPAHPVLTAYGLMEFTDMQRVQAVDAAMLARTQAWLLSQQRPDGRWTMASTGIPEGATNAYAKQDMRVTAYIAWALAESGVEDPRLSRAHDVIEAAIEETSDSYTLALFANALIAGKRAIGPVITKLAAAHREEKSHAWWTSKSQGVTYGGGAALDEETTALASYALLRSKSHVDVAQKALAWLIAQRDRSGTWSSTQATVAAMRALLAGSSTTTVDEPLEVSVIVDGETVKTIPITPDNADVFHLVSLRAPIRKGARQVELRSTGGGTIAYQLVTTHYRRWPEPTGAKELSLGLTYSATSVRVGDAVDARVLVHNRRSSPLDMVMVDIPIVPGLVLDTASLDRLVQSGSIERYERRGAQMSVYLRSVPASGAQTFSYRLVAQRVVSVQAPAASAYLYYEPAVRDATRPVAMQVTR